LFLSTPSGSLNRIIANDKVRFMRIRRMFAAVRLGPAKFEQGQQLLDDLYVGRGKQL